MKGLSAFGRFLWQGAEADGAVPSLTDALVATTKRGKAAQLTVTTVMADGADPVHVLAGGGKLGSRRWGHIGVLLFEDAGGPYVVAVWPDKREGIFHLVGVVPVTDKRWQRVERRVEHAAPAVVPVILNQDDFDGIISDLAHHGRVEVSRLNLTKVTDGANWQVTHPGKPEPRPSYDEAVSEISAPAYVRTAALHVADKLHLHLRRKAGATYYSGEWPMFETIVLDGLAAAAHRRARLLSGRARTIEAPAVLRPIAVRLSSNLFSSPAKNRQAIDVLHRQSHVGLSVLHGNPYLHVAVTDYLDGSNFDAVVTSPDEIVLYPGYRASLGALARLTDYLAEEFGGVDVVDASDVRPVTSEELLGTA